jgi:putative transposase
LKAYKYRLYPNKEQEILLAKHFGVCRYIYNKALDIRSESYKNSKESVNMFQISKMVTEWKKELIWLKEVNSQSIQSSLRNLDVAFTNFFKKKSKYPNFKSKHHKQSFSSPQNCKVDFDNGRFFCPKFKNGIKCVFHREFVGNIKTCTISRTKTGKYYVSILVETNLEKLKKIKPTFEKNLGIDLGIKDFAIFSDGTKIKNPKHLKWKLKSLKRQQRKLSRKKKGSNNRNKQRIKVARIHEKVSNARLDFLHKLSYSIAENQDYTSVSMEKLDIQQMIKNKYLSRNIMDCGWYLFQTLLKYKLDDKGKSLILIGQYEPSSKKCSNCANINHDLKLKDRIWTCEKCETTHDRDVNAAINIRNLAFSENNTKSQIGKELPELTLLEIENTQSLKEESLSFMAG